MNGLTPPCWKKLRRTRKKRSYRFLVGLLGAILMATACSRAAPAVAEPYLTAPADLRPVPLAPGDKLRVVATTSILADVVGRIGGDGIALHSLIPAGVDPHAFEPNPKDAQALAEADVVFVNGFGLETFMEGLIRQAGTSAAVISASSGVKPLPFAEQGSAASGVDPHTWFDPNNVIQWTRNIEAALTALDPSRAALYAANAEAYRIELATLDQDIRQTVAPIPPESRKLITDHNELGYFADEYGFTVIGAVIPGASSLAEPSAAQLAELLDKVRAEKVSAVFVTSVVHPSVVDTFAADAGIRVVTLYGHSLTGADGPAPSYLAMMRYNAEAIAAALTP